MGFIYTLVAALCVWLVMWALNVKAIDAFLVAIVIMLVALTVRMLGSSSTHRG
jgi:hypothetical protein